MNFFWETGLLWTSGRQVEVRVVCPARGSAANAHVRLRGRKARRAFTDDEDDAIIKGVCRNSWWRCISPKCYISCIVYYCVQVRAMAWVRVWVRLGAIRVCLRVLITDSIYMTVYYIIVIYCMKNFLSFVISYPKSLVRPIIHPIITLPPGRPIRRQTGTQTTFAAHQPKSPFQKLVQKKEVNERSPSYVTISLRGCIKYYRVLLRVPLHMIIIATINSPPPLQPGKKSKYRNTMCTIQRYDACASVLKTNVFWMDHFATQKFNYMICFSFPTFPKRLGTCENRI